MTVQTALARVDYDGNGTTTEFPVPFPFLLATDLVVLVTEIATGEETTLTLDSGGANGYTVEGEGEATGDVTTVTAWSADYRITIYREVPITQLADYEANEGLPAETVERSYDKLTMICADLAATIARCLQFSPGTSTDVSVVLPLPEARSLLGWAADEESIVNYVGFEDVDLVISTFIDELLQLTTLEEVQAYLEITALSDLGPLATIEPTGTGFLRDDDVYSEELNSMPVGYRRVAWTQANANTGFVLADYTAGKGFRKDSTAAPTWTIPANGSVAFPIGTMIPLCNVGASGDVTLAITTDTLQRAGSTSTGSVTLEPGFFGGVEKVSDTLWIVFGAFPA